MVRALGLVSVLSVLAVGGYLYTQSANETLQPAVSGAVQDAAVEAAADATLLAARTGVEAFFAAGGTYAGTTVPTGVVLVAADAASYCLQIGSGATVRHLPGPGGSPTPGPC